MTKPYDIVNTVEFRTCSYELLQTLAKEWQLRLGNDTRVSVLKYSPRRRRYAVAWKSIKDSGWNTTYPKTAKECHAWLRNRLHATN